MKRLFVISIAFVMLAACTPTPTVAPTVAVLPSVTPLPTIASTAIPTVTATPIPTATALPTATATREPTFPVAGLQTNEYPSARLANEVIAQYAQAMNLKPETISLKSMQAKDRQGKSLVVATTADGTPLLIAEQKTDSKEILWQDVSLRKLADANGISFSAPVNAEWLNDPTYAEILRQSVNQVLVTYDLDTRVVFGRFGTEDWRKVVSNWEQIKQQLGSGIVPVGFTYNWTRSQKDVDFAKKNAMLIRAQHLLWGGDIADSIVNGNFTPEELSRILEFTVKVKVLQYRGQIAEWDGADETNVEIINMGGNGSGYKYGFWVRQLGAEEIVFKVFQWAHEADPSAKLVMVEDHVLESPFANLQPRLTERFLNLLREFKARKIPVDGVDIENNFWIYAPPSRDYMVNTLRTIRDMGYYLATPETTVIITPVYPIYGSIPPTPSIRISDPLKAQAQLYQDTLEVYLELNAVGFGFGDLTDRFSWIASIGKPDANAMIMDSNNKPKMAYYAIAKTLLKHLTK